MDLSVRISDLFSSWFGSSSVDDCNREPLEKVKRDLREEMGLEDWIFDRLWAQAEHRFGFPISYRGLKPEEVQQVRSALQETFIYSGSGIDIGSFGETDEVRESIFSLFGRSHEIKKEDEKEITPEKLLKSGPEVLLDMQNAVRQILASCCKRFPDEKNDAVYQAFIGHMVSWIPYFHPEEGACFQIPQKIDGKWVACDYVVDKKFELTPSWFSSPMTAYGFVSDTPGAKPLISFLGTTYPSSQGFVATVLADATPGLSVGHLPYLCGKEQIGEWLEEKNGVGLYGLSLGGALAFQVLRNHSEKIGFVEVFNAPGLYPWNWDKSYDQEINIYYQDKDLIGTGGLFPEGKKVSVFRVIPPEEDYFYNAHTEVYTSRDRVTLLKSDATFENHRLVRKVLTATHLIIGPLLIFLPVLGAYLVSLVFSGASRHACKLVPGKVQSAAERVSGVVTTLEGTPVAFA